ncbi:MAG TPA: hypothetical protein ENK10_00405 [Acidobacteria bacterium]|nr:hypothetical protein [Acidobacteriota bacterium]
MIPLNRLMFELYRDGHRSSPAVCREAGKISRPEGLCNPRPPSGQAVEVGAEMGCARAGAGKGDGRASRAIAQHPGGGQGGQLTGPPRPRRSASGGGRGRWPAGSAPPRLGLAPRGTEGGPHAPAHGGTRIPHGIPRVPLEDGFQAHRTHVTTNAVIFGRI